MNMMTLWMLVILRGNLLMMLITMVRAIFVVVVLMMRIGPLVVMMI